MAVFTTRSPTIDTIDARRAEAGARKDPPRISLFMMMGDCQRAAFLDFVWVLPPEPFEPAQLRHFDRKRAAETDLIDVLSMAGVKVETVDLSTYRNWTVNIAGGHCHLEIPAMATGLPEAPATAHVMMMRALCETAFQKLMKEGVAKARPADYAALQLGMAAYGRRRAAVLAVNLGTDELHLERIEADPFFAARLTSDIERLVGSQRVPPRLHEDEKAPGAWQCRRCRFSALCHGQRWPRRTCRTCIHATALTDGDDGRWTCARHSRDLSADDQRAGCPNHLYLPDLVPGEQTDANPDEEWIDYRLADGSTWRDSAGTGGN